MTDVPIGGGDELHVMPLLRPLHGDTRAAVFRVVRMRAENDDSELTVVSSLGGGSRARASQSHTRVRAGDVPDNKAQGPSGQEGQCGKSNSRFHADCFL